MTQTSTLNERLKLNPNDLVALLSPAGFIPDESPVAAAVNWLESIGMRALVGKNVLKRDGVFAGTDRERLEDFQSAIDNPEVKAIWALRGGYGAIRIIDKIDFSPLQKNPKLLIGFSDITVFHNQWQLMGLPCIHGMMPIQIAKNLKENQMGLESLRKALMGAPLNYDISSSKHNQIGTASGILTGGNLTLLQNLIGTPYQTKTKGKILFIEEVGEYMYRLDRLLYSLKLAGVFKDLKGLIVGGFTDIKESETPFGKTIEQMILEVTKGTDYPILFDFPAGHFPDNRALILGAKVKLRVEERYSKITFK